MKKSQKSKASAVKAPIAEVPSSPVVTAPVVTAPVVNPIIPADQYVMGIAQNTKRVKSGTRIERYRVVNNQRKNCTATHYVQGGYSYPYPGNKNREFFQVGIEIPMNDLREAQLLCIELNAKLQLEKESAA